MTLEKKFGPMLFTCWLAYSCAYFCRVNLSISVPYLQEQFGWDKGTVGMIASSFFWAYAAGQLINGAIGDRFNPRYFVALGLTVAGAANILMSQANSLGVMLLLWGINGYSQSMLWGPIVRTVSIYTPKNKFNLMAMLLSTAMVVGYLGSYTAISKLAAVFSWRYMFLLPGLLLLAGALFWVFMLRGFKADHLVFAEQNGKEAGWDEPGEAHPLKDAGVLRLVWRSKLYLVALICVMQGILKEGIALWGPTFISEFRQLDFQDALHIMSLVPLMNLCGTFLTGLLNKLFRYREKRTMIAFFCLCVLCATGLYLFAGSAFWAVAFFGVLSAMVFGVNSVLTTVIPLNFYTIGRVSTAAGFVDCAIYLGAALSGPLLGTMADKGGWNSVILLWIGAAVLAAMLSLLSVDYKRGIPS